MKASMAGTILVALALGSLIGGPFVGTALGEDHDRRPTQQYRGGHERDGRDTGAWRDHGGWRDNRGWHAYRPVYAPPPVLYAPSPSPGISIFFPLFR
jgi:hypothetical protein